MISLSHSSKHRAKNWNCVCECGKERVVRGDALTSKATVSCGCFNNERARKLGLSSRFRERKCRTVKLSQRFGKLITISYTGDSRVGWGCKCDCGGTRVVRSHDLKSGRIVDCRCGHADRKRKQLREANITHGLSHVPGYGSWRAMKNRCTKENDPGFPKYGAAGILPCKAMHESPRTMFDAIGIRLSPKLELDRTDNALGYFCGICDDCKQNGRATNIKWSTSKEQMRNRSNNRLFTIDGVTHCASEWAEKFGLTWAQFTYRYRANKVVKSG